MLGRPTHRAPRSAARSEAASWPWWSSGFAGFTKSTFQLRGRSAASDISHSRSTCSSEKGPTVGMNSSVVPGCSRTARHLSDVRQAVARLRRYGMIEIDESAPNTQRWLKISLPE